MDYTTSTVENAVSSLNEVSKVHNLDISDPIDFKTPIESLGGNRKLYFSMLARFEVMSLNSCMA